MTTFNPKASEVVHTPQFEDGLKRALTLTLSKHLSSSSSSSSSTMIESIITDTVIAVRNIVDFNQIPPPRPFKCPFEYFASRDINKRNASFDRQKLRETWEKMPQSLPENSDQVCFANRIFEWQTKAYYEDLHQQRIVEWDDWKSKEIGSAAYRLYVAEQNPEHPSIAWQALSDEKREEYVEKIETSCSF